MARDAATRGQIQAEIMKVTDMKDILAYDVTSTPALVINDKVVSAGRIPSIADVQAWMAEAGSPPARA